MATSYQDHVRKWKGCRLCPLWESRRKVVFVRGSLPCDVLFIGEAPGVSEDLLGKPFAGPAGKLLDRIIARGLPKDLRYAITNLVGCIPLDDDDGKREPPDDAIKSCLPKLDEILLIGKPRIVVFVGRIAARKVPRKHSFVSEYVEILHPAAILRMDVSQQGLAIQRCVCALEQIDEEVPF